MNNEIQQIYDNIYSLLNFRNYKNISKQLSSNELLNSNHAIINSDEAILLYITNYDHNSIIKKSKQYIKLLLNLIAKDKAIIIVSKIKMQLLIQKISEQKKQL